MSGASFARVEVQFSVCGFEILTTTPTPILLLGHNRSQGEVRYPSSTYISLITNSEPGCPVTQYAIYTKTAGVYIAYVGPNILIDVVTQEIVVNTLAPIPQSQYFV